MACECIARRFSTPSLSASNALRCAALQMSLRTGAQSASSDSDADADADADAEAIAIAEAEADV